MLSLDRDIRKSEGKPMLDQTHTLVFDQDQVTLLPRQGEFPLVHLACRPRTVKTTIVAA